uniref:Uncharacterized protein n=1 Tax=Anopheles dirus TaxID=7168 RepID=A0A182NXC2_9DIPT
MLTKVLYILQEAGNISLEEICNKMEKLDHGDLLVGGMNTQPLAILKALDQGIKFGFITSDPKRRLFKLGVDFRRSETY